MKKKKPGAKSAAKPAKSRGRAPQAARTAGASAKAPAAKAPSRGGRGPANVRPLGDRILVRRLDLGEAQVGGIIIPDTAKEKPQQAQVVAVGSGRMLETGKRVAPAVKAGDRVLVGKWSGTEVKLEGQEYLILKEDEVLGILG